jgi:thioredoxin-like negative regulator of GroEL
LNAILLYSALFAGIGADQPLNYRQAYDQSLATRRPLLVLVGADWCPACRSLKHGTLANMLRRGELKDVAYAIVDVDQEPQIAGKIQRSSSIPQLVLFTPASSGWLRLDLQGNQPPARIAAMIRHGLELQRLDGAAKRPEKSVGD